MKKIYALLPLAFLFCQCEKWLDIDLPNNQVNTENVFKDPATIQAALAQLYVNLNNPPNTSISQDLSLYTDELTLYGTSIGSGGYQDFYTNQLLATSGQHLAYWTNAYKHIYTINAFLEGLTASSAVPTPLKNTYLGEAYFLRAYHYYQLSQLYGDVAWVATTDYRYNTTVSKMPYATLLQKIETDLKTARDLLTTSYRSTERIYPNQSVVSLLLAKTYLLQKKYDVAVQYAREVLNNPNYSLNTSDLNQVFSRTATGTLWQLKASDNAARSNSFLSTFRFVSYPPPVMALSTALLNRFEPQDRRLQNWTFKVSNGTQSAYYAYKYQSDAKTTGPWPIVYRIEEAYLTLAEALAYDDKIPEATPYLNAIRQRANLLPLPLNLDLTTFKTELMAEYQREFFTEYGHRFFDLKRNEKLSDLLGTKSSWSARNARFPIPEEELRKNPNLLPQNP